MLWFLRGVQKGIVTTRYPVERDAWATALPTPPRFRSDLLTHELAEQLVAACPSSAVRHDGADLVLDLGACTACGRCAEIGGEAVAASGEFELASSDRGALVKRIPIGRKE